MAGEASDVSSARGIAEASILLSFAFLGTILAGAMLTALLRFPPVFSPPWNLAGLGVAVVGGASLAYCGLFLSRHGRGTPYPRRPPKRLVTTGPFARVRNPIIASWGTLIVGVGISMDWAGLLLLIIPAFAAVHLYVVYHEEPILARRFGAEYDVYRSRVPRWIPRLRT